MSLSLCELSLKAKDLKIKSDSGCYRPPSWPPPADWVVSEDAQGKPLSIYGGPFWDFSAWAGRSCRFHFAGEGHGTLRPVGPANQNILRMLAAWILWGPKGWAAWKTLKLRFDFVRRIVLLCEDEGIRASELVRFPKVKEKVYSLFTSTETNTVLSLLDRLLRAKSQLGFALMESWDIAALKKDFLEKGEKGKETEQAAYIPPRIWVYQNLRLRECLDDFHRHRQQIEECFNFCVDAYAHNFGSLEKALVARKSSSAKSPFGKQVNVNAGARTGYIFHGPFEAIAIRFGISDLLKKWGRHGGSLEINSFASYLTLIQYAGIAYIMNFTFQRKEEAGSLMADCLVWEDIPEIGRVPVIRGETTKTDPDSDARWPTSPSVAVAVSAMDAVARLRIQCARVNPVVACSAEEQSSPNLFHMPFEPWSSVGKWRPYAVRPPVINYSMVVRRFPKLFDVEQLRITEDDLAKARMFTPNLDKGGLFSVGKVWPLSFHQLRRTGGVNMFASGILSDTSIQVILKHLVLQQTYYYGRNFSRLRINEEFLRTIDDSRYEVMAKQIASLVEERYVSPLGEARKQEIAINLVNEKTFKELVKAGRKGEISFRETRLGGCTKNGPCEYGGIESVARCSGGDGDKACREAIYDKAKRPMCKQQLAETDARLRELPAGSPRAGALEVEAQGLRNFLHATID